MKKIKYILFTIFVTLLSITPVFAGHQCEYAYEENAKKADVIITYSEDNVTIESEKIKTFFKKIADKLTDLMVVINGIQYTKLESSSPLLTESINSALSNGSCPASGTLVCSGLVSSLNLPFLNQFFGAGETVASLFSPIWEDYDSIFDYFGEIIGSLETIPEVGEFSDVLMVAASQNDAEKTFGYEKGWFNINWDGFYKADERFNTRLYSYSNIECKGVYYIGTRETFDLNCPYLTKHINEYETIVKECNSNDSECSTKIKQKEESLTSLCSSILVDQDYYLTDNGIENSNEEENSETESSEGETSESDEEENNVSIKANKCVTECLSLDKKIIEIKKNSGLIGQDTGQCGFSDRLMVWISNILRWIKYLLPVAVIVLAILDFIKAIGSDKDDEMKKAQGRFVKRLIVAALVFLVPLIIEFILDKMGFGYDDCGLF